MTAEHEITFTFDDAVAGWNMSCRSWLVENKKENVWNSIATANVVFNQEGRVLLVQRAAHDTRPGMWEVPGGAVDDDDPTVLYAAARELREEAGLHAKRFVRVVGEGPGRELEQLIPSGDGKKVWCRFTFVAEVEDSRLITLDPNEHQDYLWASEDEIRTERIGERAIPMTSSHVQARLLEAFRLRESS